MNNDYIPYPYELFGIECEKGWFKLLEPIFDYIKEYNKDKDDEHKIEITQIKEKWGTLRVYVNFGTDELFKLIDEAEDKSELICEFCGSEENVGSTKTGWISTICLDCVKKQAKQTNFPKVWISNNDKKEYIIKPDETIEEITNKEMSNP